MCFGGLFRRFDFQICEALHLVFTVIYNQTHEESTVAGLWAGQLFQPPPSTLSFTFFRSASFGGFPDFLYSPLIENNIQSNLAFGLLFVDANSSLQLFCLAWQGAAM